MLTAVAHVRTERPSRYLVQLCRHAGRMSQHLRHGPRAGDTHAPPEVRHVEWSDTHGIVRLSWGQWTLHATQNTLTLRAEATNDEDLQRIQDLLTARLENIGRRDHLTVTWQRRDTPTAHPGDDPHPTERPRGTRRRRSRTAPWLLVAAVGLFLAVHLGLGTAVLAASPWTIWTRRRPRGGPRPEDHRSPPAHHPSSRNLPDSAQCLPQDVSQPRGPRQRHAVAASVTTSARCWGHPPVGHRLT
ncbi:MAG: DUF2218 domain-containing protein [Actinophytocola sp.]|uniref:DUF2218 domain-containing protein n=1 Tax=Actinophytocola sp. TaxID=1872138 RepID=UPI001326112F|nr:DUF2218 domain-containing protein [Actinophytocola sp.]